MSAPLHLAQEGYRPSIGVVSRNRGSLTGATYATVVSAPGETKTRQVIVVTVPNTTGGAIDIKLAINDGTTRTMIDYATGVAAGSTYSSALRLPIILLRDTDYLEVALGAAGTPDFYATWAEWNATVLGDF